MIRFRKKQRVFPANAKPASMVRGIAGMLMFPDRTNKPRADLDAVE
jgi:hypothetical protein